MLCNTRNLMSVGAVLVCATTVAAQMQSPISFDFFTPFSNAWPVHTNYGVSNNFSVANLGGAHPTVKVTAPAGNNQTLELFDSATATNQIWRLKEFHFHRSSEHTVTIDLLGNPETIIYDMEVHIVHERLDAQGMVLDDLLVIGRWMQSGAVAHPGIAAVLNVAPAAGQPAVALNNLDMLSFVPPINRRGSFRYTGSLTTGAARPYREGVRWVMYEELMEISPAQLAAFAGLFPVNNEPTQDLNGRVVTRDVPAPGAASLLVIAGIAAHGRRRRVAS